MHWRQLSYQSVPHFFGSTLVHPLFPCTRKSLLLLLLLLLLLPKATLIKHECKDHQSINRFKYVAIFLIRAYLLRLQTVLCNVAVQQKQRLFWPRGLMGEISSLNPISTPVYSSGRPCFFTSNQNSKNGEFCIIVTLGRSKAICTAENTRNICVSA